MIGFSADPCPPGEPAATETCGTCRFYWPIGTITHVCRRHPPTPAGPNNYGVFPVINTDEDWCGEYEPEART